MIVVRSGSASQPHLSLQRECDFRIWSGTVLAYRALPALDGADDPVAAKRNVVETIRIASGELGNTPAVARGSYVHPAVLEAYLERSVGPPKRKRKRERTAAGSAAPTSAVADPKAEAAVLELLQERPNRDARV
jgi:DNA topoisomerase-1